MDVLEAVVAGGCCHAAVPRISPLRPVETADDWSLVKEDVANVNLAVSHHMTPKQRVIFDRDPTTQSQP